MDETDTADVGSGQSDQKDLAAFGYKQELHRTLGFFSSSPQRSATSHRRRGIFTLFALGLTTIGGVFIWSWPIVAAGQMLVALNFAESRATSGGRFGLPMDQVLAGRPYAWFTGWIYLFAGVLTVTAVVVTLPLTILPMLNLMGWNLDAAALHDQIWVAAITLVVITVLNIYSVKVVSVVNNTGVFSRLSASWSSPS